MSNRATHRMFLPLTLVFGVGLMTACNPPSDSDSAEALPDDHDELVAMAQEEGVVQLGAGGHTERQAELLAAEFEDAYGVEVQFVRENSGQIAQKVEAQLSGGNMAFDAISLNDTSTLDSWAEEGVIATGAVDSDDDVMETLSTADAHYHPFTWAALGYSYNTARVDEGDTPTTWEELAAANGTKVVAEPGSSGAALTFAATMAEVDDGFFGALGDGEVLTAESALALGQTIATGEADYGIPGIEHDVATAQDAGEPLTMGYPEGDLGVMTSYIADLDSADNPAAARLLVQFSMSPEFQEAQRDIGSRSTLDEFASPDNVEEIDEERLVVLDESELAANRDDIIAEFDEAVR